MRAVLFVDDDAIMLRSLERGFQDEQFDKHFAGSGEEALEILRREEVHVLVTDMCMCEMSGAELIRIVKREYPDIVSIMHSGYAPTDELRRAIHREKIFKFVCKTVTLEEDLKQVVRQAVDHYDLQSQHEKVLAKSEWLG
ncbi:MAG: hypothetical protein AMJ65_14370 [Phycisphaerae bacterium SG8_4]|nr:MAG: hypothetical protein AMJ65_14370 [Phycisphaerae bacterium SG8_4]